MDDLPLKASTLKTVGDKYSRMGQHLKLAGDKWVDPYIEPSSVNYSGMEQYHKALEIYTRALKIEDQLGNLPRKTNLLNLIGLTYSSIGDNNSALKTYGEVLRIETNLDNKINFLNNMGFVYEKIGDIDLAIEKFKEALTLANKLEESSENERSYKKKTIEMLEYHLSGCLPKKKIKKNK